MDLHRSLCLGERPLDGSSYETVGDAPGTGRRPWGSVAGRQLVQLLGQVPQSPLDLGVQVGSHSDIWNSGKERRYRLTLGVTRLGLSALSATSLSEHAHPYMQDLANDCGYTIALAVLDDAEILCLDRTHSTRYRHSPEHPDPHTEPRLPLHCTATGKLLLAHLPKKERTGMLRELSLTRHTPKTITRKQMLREEIQHIALVDLAVNDEELMPGRHAIAVPIRSADHTAIAALSMAAATSSIRLQDLVQDLAPHLVATADRISARLGYRRPDEYHNGKPRASP